MGGHTAPLLELDETDQSELFADCSGWIASSHPYTGDEELVAAPWRVDGHRPGLRRHAPLLGADDDDILTRILGLPDDDIAPLKSASVIGLAGHFE